MTRTVTLSILCAAAIIFTADKASAQGVNYSAYLNPLNNPYLYPNNYSYGNYVYPGMLGYYGGIPYGYGYGGVPYGYGGYGYRGYGAGAYNRASVANRSYFGLGRTGAGTGYRTGYRSGYRGGFRR